MIIQSVSASTTAAGSRCLVFVTTPAITERELPTLKRNVRVGLPSVRLEIRGGKLVADAAPNEITGPMLDVLKDLILRVEAEVAGEEVSKPPADPLKSVPYEGK